MDSNLSDNHVPEDFEAEQEHANGVQAFAMLGRYLADNDWQPLQVPDKYIYRILFRGNNAALHCYAQIRVEAEQLLFYVMAPIKVEEPLRPAVAEFITRANYGMYIGNFEMDYNDGEVRYKSSLDFEGVGLSDIMIRNAIYPAMQLMDKYFPGLMKVAFGGKSPAEAIQEIEGE